MDYRPPSATQISYWNKSNTSLGYSGFITAQETVNSYYKNYSKTQTIYRYGLITNHSIARLPKCNFGEELVSALDKKIRGMVVNMKMMSVLSQKIGFQKQNGQILEVQLQELFSMYLKTLDNIQNILIKGKQNSKIIKPFVSICHKLQLERVKLTCNDSGQACQLIMSLMGNYNLEEPAFRRSNQPQQQPSAEEYQQFFANKISRKAIDEAERLISACQAQDQIITKSEKTDQPGRKEQRDRRNRIRQSVVQEQNESDTDVNSMLCRELKLLIQKTDKILKSF